jgi:hypothetical protein
MMATCKLVSSPPGFEDCRKAIIDAIRPFTDQIDQQGILAILAYTTGQTIAYCDQRKLTPEQAMDIVARNIELGNAAAIEQTFANPAGRA